MAAHPAKTLLGVVALAFAAAVCGLVGAYLPPLQIALPVLLGVVVRRVGLLPGAGAWAGALVLLFFMAPPYGPLWVAVATGLPGLLLGLLFKNHVPGGRALAAVVGCSAGVVLLCLPVAVRAGLVSPPPAPMPAAVESLGSLISGAEARAWAGRMWEAARFLAPANLLLWTVLVAVAAYFLLVRLFRFWGLPAGESISWRSLSLPWYALWLPILGLGMSLAGDQWHWASVAAAGKYVLYLSAWPFLAVGCAVAAHYLGSFGDRRYLRLLLLAAALVSWPLAVVACIVVGVLDPVCNWRRVGEGRGDKDRWK